MTARALLLLPFLALAGCGNSFEDDAEDRPPYSDPRGQVSITRIYSPNLRADIECVVATGGRTGNTAIAISCNWP